MHPAAAWPSHADGVVFPRDDSGRDPSPLHQQRRRPISASPAWSCHRGSPAAASLGPFPSGSGTLQVAISIPIVAAPPGVARHHEHNAVTPHGLVDDGGHCQALRRTMQEGHGTIDIQSMNMHN